MGSAEDPRQFIDLPRIKPLAGFCERGHCLATFAMAVTLAMP